MTDPTLVTSTPTAAEQTAIAYLRSPQAIRERCGYLLELACGDRLSHFRCDLNRLDAVADYVLQVTRQAYPDLQVPFHSRWRHFEVGSPNRLAAFDQQMAKLSPLQRAQAKFDLAITSVLLDAGAGAVWRYVEPGTADIYQRSEGLAVASFYLFQQGTLSSQPDCPWQADAIGLQQFTAANLAHNFQVQADNPLVGLDGRASLLQRLGQTLQRHPQLFGSDEEASGASRPPRPGYLVNYLLHQAADGRLSANAVLQAILLGLGEIWPGRVTIGHTNLGDVWPHPALQGEGIGGNLVPFHKLSQWLTYSLLEPLQELGLEITDLDLMTGLPEYRNGGLCLDLGLLQAKHPDVTQGAHLPGSDVIVEWRALTVGLLDQITATIRQQLQLDQAALPLVKVLQGGTWSAGRQIAASLRPGGVPPIQIASDGTVF